MNSISKNLNQIKYLDVCLTSTQKELIIQRLSNHCQFYSQNFNIIIKSLFTSNIKFIKFYKCEQINDVFLKLIAKKSKFQLKSLTITRCDNITGKLMDVLLKGIFSVTLYLDDSLRDLIENQHNLEDVCFKRLNTQFAQTFACLKSTKLSIVDLSYTPTVTDRGVYFIFFYNR